MVQRLRRATAGEFEVGRELGRGGMAAVFLAHEISLDRKVAIKVMSPGLLMGDGMIDRFKREAITIAHLNHPNIVSCYSVRQAGGLHFFVMRYIRGRSLDQLIQDSGRLPLPIVRSILCQVGSALTYAHRSRVVHRDIKPANILIDEDGNAVVTDFGIAKVAELPGHTHTGALVGTPAYMSPEQCSGEDVSGASDQYSLGAVAYEMVTGTAPFTGSTLTVMQSQVEHAPPAIRDRCPECPADLEAAILRMLAKDPAERFPNMAEAKAALGAVPLMEDDPLLAELSRLAAGRLVGDAGRGSAIGAHLARPRLAAFEHPVAGSAGAPAASPSFRRPPSSCTGDGFALVALVRGDRGVPAPRPDDRVDDRCARRAAYRPQSRSGHGRRRGDRAPVRELRRRPGPGAGLRPGGGPRGAGFGDRPPRREHPDLRATEVAARGGLLRPDRHPAGRLRHAALRGERALEQQ